MEYLLYVRSLLYVRKHLEFTFTEKAVTENKQTARGTKAQSKVGVE